jgi:hypothetical protein
MNLPTLPLAAGSKAEVSRDSYLDNDSISIRTHSPGRDMAFDYQQNGGYDLNERRLDWQNR